MEEREGEEDLDHQLVSCDAEDELHLEECVADDAVSVTYHKLATTDVGQLAAMLSGRRTAVASVELNGNELDEHGVCHFATTCLPHLSKLKVLDLSDNRAGPVGCRALREALVAHCPGLTALNLDYNNIQNEGARECAFLLRDCRELRVLSLVTNGLNYRGIAPFVDGLLLSATLETLLLDYNALGDRGTAMLCSALATACPSLTQLGLSDNGIGLEGAQAVAALLRSPSCALQTLNLSVNRIDANGVAVLVEALKLNKSLANLDVGCNPLGADGRRALFSSADKYATLRLLDITSVGATNDDFDVLANRLRRGGGLCSIQWFNNPEVTPDREAALAAVLAARDTVESGASGAGGSAVAVLRIAGAVASMILLCFVAKRLRERSK